MADPKDTLDPEPVDAEFEPADDSPSSSRASNTRARKPRGGAFGHFLVFLLATAAGGGVGFGAARYLPAPVDAGAAAERAALTNEMTGIETRLAALETEDPTVALGADLSAIEQRLAALEALPTAGAGADPVDLSAIDARLAALETAPPATTPAGPGFDGNDLEARLSALETSQALTEATAQQALEANQANSPAAIDPQILQALTDRISEIEASVDRLPQPVDTSRDVTRLTDDIANLRRELTAVRTQAETALSNANSAAATVSSQPDDTGLASRQLAARALALTALREIAGTGEGFEAERAALSRLWRGNADLAAMADYSRAGVPTLNELTESFPGPAIREAAGPGRVFFGLIAVRRTDGSEGDSGPLAMTALVERRLADDDLVGAITIAERLDGEALDAVRDWLIQARARHDLSRRLQSLRDALAATAAEQGSDPT